jgi:hypothetical protein
MKRLLQKVRAWLARFGKRAEPVPPKEVDIACPKCGDVTHQVLTAIYPNGFGQAVRCSQGRHGYYLRYINGILMVEEMPREDWYAMYAGASSIDEARATRAVAAAVMRVVTEREWRRRFGLSITALREIEDK